MHNVKLATPYFRCEKTRYGLLTGVRFGIYLIVMEPLASPSSPWLDYAEAFFNAEEDRRRYSFLARNSLHFLEASELTVVETRIAQSAIPEVADGCLIALRTESGEW